MCFINNGNCTIELIESPDPENHSRKDGIVDHLSIRVVNAFRLNRFYKLHKLGISSKDTVNNNEATEKVHLNEKVQNPIYFEGAVPFSCIIKAITSKG
jgi:hypothetical protein